MDKYQTAVLDLLADNNHELQKLRSAITDLTEALAGVRREAVGASAPETAPDLDRSNSTPEDRTAYLASLRKVFAAQSKAGKKDELKALLHSFGATKLPEVNEENWPELKAKAEAL